MDISVSLQFRPRECAVTSCAVGISVSCSAANTESKPRNWLHGSVSVLRS